MALALYRKYRPRTFAEVIGQEHVTEPLSQALRSGRLHHAYLFSGPRGCGKTSSARILARSLNCEQGPTPDPCGVCASCKSLANDGVGSIDVIEIDAASHGGVDDARELREKAFFAPAASRYKIYVIDEAHMVSPAGFNALLKLVEEPPDYVKFIFATTEPEKVLGTIRSRTHHYPFRLIPPAVLRPYLQQLTEAEGIYVEPAVFPLVVRAGAGSARDSLSVLDQLIAGAGPEGVGYARAVALLGVTDVTLIDEMCDALAAGDGATAYATIDRVAEAGHDPRRFASDLLERFRDLIVLQQVPDAVTKGLIDGPADQLEAMSAQATRLGPATLSRCADIVHNGLVEMRGTTAPRLLLELITARMLLPGAEDSTGALLQRLERMERRLTLSPGDQGVRGEAAPAMSGPAGAPGGSAAARVPSDDGGSVAVAASSGAGLSAARAAAASAGRRAPASGSEGGASPVGSEPGASTSAPEVANASGEDDSPPWAEDEPVRPVPAQARKPESAPVPTTSARSSADEDGPGGSSPVDGAPGLSPAADVGAGRSPNAGDAPIRPAAGDDASNQPPAAETMPVRPPESAILPDAPAEPDIVEPVSGGAPGQLTAAAVREVWPEIITAVGRQSKKVAALASGATVRDLDGQTVVLTFRFPAHAKMVSDQPQLLVDALYEALGGNWQIRCEIAGEAGGVGRASPGGNAGGGGPAGGVAVSGRGSGSAADQKVQAPRTQPSRQREAAAPPATRVDEGDDWPEPVRPGGAAPAGEGSAAAGPGGDERQSVTAPDSVTSAGAAPASAGAKPAAGGPVGSAAEGAAAGAAGGPAAAGGTAAPGGMAPGGMAPGGMASSGTAPGGTAPGGAAPGGTAPSGTAPGGMAAARAAAAGAARQAAARAGGKGDGSATTDGPPMAPGVATVGGDAAPAGGGAKPGGGVAGTSGVSRPGGGAGRPGGPGRPSVGAGRPESGAARVGGGAATADAAAKAAAAGSWSDGSPAEEPPYDPEYDGPPAGAGASFEGFDPGDEPLDDVIDEKTARQSSEQQAMQLLRDAFGAEKISET